MVKWPICGPKLSLCCSIISVWGIVQFLFLGIFFFIEAAPLLNDFDINNEIKDTKSFEINLKHAYQQRAYNCWIAAFLYVGLLVFAGSQFMTNQKQISESTFSTSMASAFASMPSDENGFNQQIGMEFNG